MKAHEYTRRAPVVVQSFEVANLKALRQAGLGRPANVTLAQLVVAGGAHDKEQPADVAASGGKLTYGEMVTARGLRDVAAYANIVAPTALVADAHEAGLQVVVWTFRPENAFLAADFRNDAGPNARCNAGSVAEIRRYLETGIDGLFSDDSALASIAIDGRR